MKKRMRCDASVCRALFSGQMSVDLGNHLIHIHTVHGAGIFQRLAAGGGATQTMHTHAQEELRRGGIHLQDGTDGGFFGDRHIQNFLSFYLSSLLYRDFFANASVFAVFGV
jgi:hypothetical protein